MPDLSFVIPAANENRWSDLLASLIATDPAPMTRLVGVNFDTVKREVVIPGQEVRKSDRLDLLLVKDGVPAAAIEVKLLSDLGPRQLERYVAAFPTATARRVLHLAGLPVNLQRAKPWESLSWEAVLTAYADSSNTWAATTARAWLRQIPTLVPAVDANTVWNDVPDDAAGMELALRARIAWLSRQLHGWCALPHDIEPSSGGGTWAVRIWAPSRASGHLVTAELQEGMTAFEWKPDPDKPYRERLRGPVVLLGLRQDDVDTSANFAWTELHSMFVEHILDEAGSPRDDRAWHLTGARPGDAIDRANWEAIVAAGAPRWLGKGWGMRVTKSARSCLFGARFQIPPDSTLGDIDAELQRLEPVIARMA
jgi:hypothetical protein